MDTERIALTGEKETLLVTLAARAEESRLPDSLLHDHWAAEAVARIDYDFARLDVDRDLMVGLALRGHLLDRWARGFLARHPEATVLHLGCGLDSRVFRLDPGAGVRWFDLDYPEVIALRRRLYPAREGVTLIGAAVTDPGWIAGIPADRPTLVLAEGLLPYVAAEEVVPLLDRLTAHLAGGELAFDAYSRIGLWAIRNHPAIRPTGARLHWALEEPRELERAIPRLRLAEELGAYDPAAWDSAQLARMSAPARWAALAVRIFPGLGKVGRLLRYAF
ncbi:class I SAM-dependent methyltransferase [Roseococcus sp. SYP-B2431]|uniref:class I SAM-dependent methyltransferase n=1 Tax=Roseococcus sp. SYP-B2431 TaxID=2496640 RepID=UPI00103AAEAE|nr:class I SAM-dependent methyltransferase [Roseococcus sp. SYP-B2431]TCI00151.1 class I SAM-dependent methyltransferase [Roseococcus sp. SYP-B2431]